MKNTNNVINFDSYTNKKLAMTVTLIGEFICAFVASLCIEIIFKLLTDGDFAASNIVHCVIFGGYQLYKSYKKSSSNKRFLVEVEQEGGIKWVAIHYAVHVCIILAIFALVMTFIG